MKAINAAKAPAAVGPYVHAIQAGNTIYTSGQLGLIPETGELAVGVEAQAEQAIKNLEVVLKEAGCTLMILRKSMRFMQSILMSTSRHVPVYRPVHCQRVVCLKWKLLQ